MHTRALTVGTLAVVLLTGIAEAQELSIAAVVDKTTVDIGDPLTVTLTLSGDVAQAKLAPLAFPEAFTVAHRSEATNLSFDGGTLQRSTTISLVLIARESGTFALGPFQVEHRGTKYWTDPIEVTVKKPPLPPGLVSPAGRPII